MVVIKRLLLLLLPFRFGLFSAISDSCNVISGGISFLSWTIESELEIGMEGKRINRAGRVF